MKVILKLMLSVFNTVSSWIYRFLSRVSRYVATAIIIYSLIWSVVLMTISLLPERYDSQWTLILPGAGVGGRVDIDSIGSASAIVESGFSSRNLSPKVNYKSIAQSSRVIELAAQSLAISTQDFGKPKIKLVDQTSLIFFTMSSHSAELAQEKSWALYHALQEEINRLRLDEIRHREQGIQKMLATFSSKLNEAKENLLDQQAKSNIITLEQFQRIPLLIEDMRIELLSLETEKEQTYEEMMTLHRLLGLTSKQASQLLELQADPLLNTLLESQTTALATQSQNKNLLAGSHPKMKETRLILEANRQDIQARIQALIGEHAWLSSTAISVNLKRNELLYDLIQKKMAYEGIKQKLIRITQQIADYDVRLQAQMKTVSRLDELQREHQIAEAVFTSAMAKIDTGKSDIFASYPMLQLFMEPNLPQSTSGAKPLHVYLGGMLGTAITTIVLITLWVRRRQIDKQTTSL